MSNKSKVLVVDDDKIMRMRMQIMLEDEYDVITAFSGEQALKLAQIITPDLILLDVAMPGISGFEVCRKLKSMAHTKDIPVIFLSGLADMEDVLKGFKAGGVDYITKPYLPALVYARIQVHMELKKYRDTLRDLTMRDGLTGIPNRRYFDDTIKREWKRAVREGSSLSLLMMDIDFFKTYNDHYGHVQGDTCLQRVAEKLASLVSRPADFVARYGGEEFVFVLPDTQRSGAEVVAKEVIKAMEQLNIEHAASEVSARVTMSIGIYSGNPKASQSPSRAIEKADKALYNAKHLGRNRYC